MARLIRFPLLFLVAVMILGACSSPTVPRYPPNDEDTGDDGDPPTQGMVMPETLPIYWA